MKYSIQESRDPQANQTVTKVYPSSPVNAPLLFQMPQSDFEGLVFDYIEGLASLDPFGLSQHPRFADLKRAVQKADEAKAARS